MVCKAAVPSGRRKETAMGVGNTGSGSVSGYNRAAGSPIRNREPMMLEEILKMSGFALDKCRRWW